MLETRPCLRCYIIIPANSSDVRCARCEAVLSLDPSYSPCYDYRIPFSARPGVMRCLNCRSRRTIINFCTLIELRHSYRISFVLSMNSFKLPKTPSFPPQRKHQRHLPQYLLPPTPAPIPRTALLMITLLNYPSTTPKHFHVLSRTHRLHFRTKAIYSGVQNHLVL